MTTNFTGKRILAPIICYILTIFLLIPYTESNGVGIEGDSITNAYFPKVKSLAQRNIKKIFPADTSRSTAYNRFTKIKFSGFFDTYVQFRNLPVRYSEIPNRHQIAINGFDVKNRTLTGFPNPLLVIMAEGKPTQATFFKITYAFDDLLYKEIKDTTGSVPSTNRLGSSYRLMQFEAGASTRVGDFKVIAGGPILWYRLSPFTMWSYQYRFDMFERIPWEPSSTAFSRYERYHADNYYQQGIQQWGYTGFQGFIIEGKSLPRGFGMSLLYGKTDNTAGFQTSVTGTTKNMGGGRLEKSIGNSTVAGNFFTQTGYTDNIANYKIRQQIVTGDFRTDLNGLKIYAEAGLGRYQDSIVQRYTSIYHPSDSSVTYASPGEIRGLNYGWRPAINLELNFTKNLVKIPFGLQAYYIDKSVVNINSAVLNSANPHARPDLATASPNNDITTFQGAITDFGQMTNNRWGLNLKHENMLGKFKWVLGAGMGQELENLFNMIYFQHRANAYVRSRFNFYQGMAGPYGRIKSIFRRSYEMIRITDVDPDYKKSYNVLDVQLKYKCNLFRRTLILTNYNNYNSVEDKLRPIPVFQKGAFIRTFYEEFMAFYSLNAKVSILGFVSYERILGNHRTELADENGNLITDANGVPVNDPNGKPIDQTDHGYGAGIDYAVTKNAGVYLRHRWFDHKDTHFTRDRFRGQETSLEVKIFF